MTAKKKPKNLTTAQRAHFHAPFGKAIASPSKRIPPRDRMGVK